MSCDASSSWPRARHAPPLAAVATTAPRRAFFLFFARKPAVSCCADGTTPADFSSSPLASSRSSSGRPWYNPIRQSQLDRGPEISRLWIDADRTLVSSPGARTNPLKILSRDEIFASLTSTKERFTVASYNILSDKNAFKHTDLYTNVPYVYMKWGRRKRVICEELLGWNPDIICLQEVDKYYDLSDILAKAGYAGSYKRRTGNFVDGCATFWKADKFKLLEGESIEYKGLGLRDNVAQISVFELHREGFLVGNIHVLYYPSRGDVKLGQVRFLSSRAHILSDKWGTAPVLLAGDFNSTPQSAIYEFLSSSELNIMLYNRRELSGQRSCHPTQVLGVKQEFNSPFSLIDGLLKNSWTDEEVLVASGKSDCRVVVHPLNLNSSYAAVKGSTGTRGSNGEPLATSYHSKFLGTVDYIWYSDGLLPTRVLDTVSLDILKRTGGLPCKKVGSDHLALVSEFAFTLNTEEADI